MSTVGSAPRAIARALAACLFAGAVAASPVLAAVPSPRSAGPQPDGTAITPEGWRITPAGSQTTVGPGPLATAMSPAGDLVLVVNAGYDSHSLMAIDPATGAIRQTFAESPGISGGPWDLTHGHNDGYYVGLAFAPDGKTAWASNGGGSSLHVFTVANGSLTERQQIKLTDNKGNANPYPAGIAVAPDGKTLYAAANLADELLVVDPAKRAVRATIPVGHLPYGVTLNRAGTRAI